MDQRTIKSIEIVNEDVVPADGSPIENLLKQNFYQNGNFQVDYLISTERKTSFLNIFIEPYRYHSDLERFQLLKACRVKVEYAENPIPQGLSVNNYPAQSVLANGKWYKIRLRNNAVYRITYSELVEMGMDVVNINPVNLRVYGNGGGMLPEANSEQVFTDLQENAIQVIGEEDGSFDENDYILFYGQSQVKWIENPGSGRFGHIFNVYDDYTYYYITADLGSGKRIPQINSYQVAPDQTITTFNDYFYHEADEVNLLGTGRKWYEKAFEFSNIFSLDFNIPGLISGSSVKLDANVAARSTANSYMSFNIDGTQFGQISIPLVYETSDTYARERSFTGSFIPNTNSFEITLEYIKTSSSGSAWLDYITLNYNRHLQFVSPQMNFRSLLSVNPGTYSEYILSAAPANIIVWNVTDPLNVTGVNGTYSGNSFRFVLPADTLSEFIAFDKSQFNKVEFVEQVDNQNLHAIQDVDLVIIVHKQFYTDAARLAEHHRTYDGLNVSVVTTGQVYNEYSSGAQDITAIRNFLKMLYHRAEKGNEPRYVLLFGDASYDYKDRIDGNTNFVPSWESKESLNMISSYVTDDYFVLLDQDEGSGAEGSLDMGIGRMPVYTLQQSRDVVDKILHYTSTATEVMKPWRTQICFVADDEDNNLHFDQADQLAKWVETNLKSFNVDKIYFDSYPQLSTPSGQRYPEVTEAINNKIEKGALVINYTGHGGELGWAHEQVLDNNDILSWQNYDNLPVFVTATCEFSRFDDPNRTAAGEYVFLNPNGGAIAMFTTARATYAGANIELNKWFYEFAFRKSSNGDYLRMGDILMLSKNAMGGTVDVNTKKYVLLGDPALRLAYPRDSVVTVSVNSIVVSEIPDTLKALSLVNVAGEVYDCNGNPLENFDGMLYSTVYDKESTITTFGQDNESSPETFKLRKNIVYNGKAQIVDGSFSFSFIVPKDIAYNFGKGRISYYATNGQTDASGFFENVIVGGYNEKAIQDLQGPRISLFINDTTFTNGGIANADPVLIAHLWDSNGINTVGNGIGHDIVAIVDNEMDNPIILNEYYEAEMDNYQKGSVTFPFFDLTEGEHTLYLKAWDVYNNSSDASITFYVVPGGELAIENLINYPNPFIDITNFVFEHNKPNQELKVSIQVFSLAGKLEAEIVSPVYSSGFRSQPVQWNGTNSNGGKLHKGMYLYRVLVETNSGLVSWKNGKLIILPQ